MTAAELTGKAISIGGGLSLSVTGYEGNEEEILQIRNENRGTLKTRIYMDWRYNNLDSGSPAKIVWIRDGADRAKGIAAIIYRNYKVGGKNSTICSSRRYFFGR